MAKKKKSASAAGGPWLATAIFCDNIIQGADGAFSVTRIVDNITLTLPNDAPADAPSPQHPVGVRLDALISFKRGSSPKTHKLAMAATTPSGKRKAIKEAEAKFSDEEYGGSTLNVQIGFVIPELGLYWFDVTMDGKLVTRMPLFVKVKREPSPETLAQLAAALPKAKGTAKRRK